MLNEKKKIQTIPFSLPAPYLILPIGGARYGHKKILGLTLFVLAWSESTNNHVTLPYIMLSFQGNQVVNPPDSDELPSSRGLQKETRNAAIWTPVGAF